MFHKLLSLVVAPLAGLSTVILFLQGRSSFLHYKYPNRFDDVAFSMEPLFDIKLFALVYTFYLAAAILFQYLIALKVWNIYQQKKQLIGIKLLLLITVACILFGLCLGLIYWQVYTGMLKLLFLIIGASIIAGIYWASNIAVLYIIDRPQKLNTS